MCIHAFDPRVASLRCIIIKVFDGVFLLAADDVEPAKKRDTFPKSKSVKGHLHDLSSI
jgi:hypothetical protein